MPKRIYVKDGGQHVFAGGAEAATKRRGLVGVTTNRKLFYLMR
jgi:hypothetical protein